MEKIRLRNFFMHYGFIEISNIVYFLSLHCKDTVNNYDLEFIRCYLGLCLDRHDNGSVYFQSLRTLHTLFSLKK